MNNTNDYKILSLYIVFGFLILLGYGQMVLKGHSSELWSNKGQNIIGDHKWLKYLYICMILFSFISGTYLVYYLTTISKNHTDEILIYTGSVLLLVFSTLWAFKPFYKYIKIVLGLVFIGVILILAGICVNSDPIDEPKKIAALAACSLLLIQTGLFDFGFWTGIIKF
jgi:hypothetical protein